MKRAVITGPTGAIGTALTEYLESKDIEVIAVVRPGSKRGDRIKESRLVRKTECDLSDLRELPKLIEGGADVFYHFGWEGTFGDGRNDMYLQNRNVKYALDAVEAAASLGCRRFIGAGSQAEYGRFEGKLNDKTPVFPENGYGMAKLCAGQMTKISALQKGIEHIWTRILSIYGPYDGDNTMVTSTIRKLLDGETPQCTKGEQMWDYLYSKDAAKAMYLLGIKGLSGRTYCLGSGNAAPLRDYIDCIRTEVNPCAQVDYGAVPYSDRQVMYLCADIEALKNDTGFVPDYTFEQGIKETADWNREICNKAVCSK